MVTGIIIGLVAGILAGMLLVFLLSPRLMFKETSSPLSFDTTILRIGEQAEVRGWKVPAIHDLQATMQKFGKEVRSVKVFEMCHPDISYRILNRSEERIVSNMMPCRIAVYEKEDGSVWISRMNAGLVSRPMSRVIRVTMSEAAREMEAIIAEVTGE
jgi:uncharacterized protein (DUF302 family)